MDATPLRENQAIDGIAAKFGIPPGYTAQIVGTGNLAVGSFIDGLVHTHTLMLQRSTIEQTGCIWTDGSTTHTDVSSNTDNFNEHTGMQGRYIWHTPSGLKSVELDKQLSIPNTTWGGENVGLILEVSNTTNETKDLYIGGLKEMCLGSITGHTESFMIRLCLTSFLESW